MKSFSSLPSKAFIIGIDIGGTSIKMGAVGSSGKIKYSKTILTPSKASDQDFLHILRVGLLSLTSNFKQGEYILKIGVGSPGPLDAEKGIIFKSPNLGGLKKCTITAFLSKHFKIDVYLQNDANCAAIGHKYFGFGKNVSDFALFTLGTGVGGGLVLNDRLFSGYKGNAFEIGHIPLLNKELADEGYRPKCGCGQYGCLETYSSATAVTNLYNFFSSGKNEKATNSEEVALKAQKKEPHAKRAFRIAGESLGLASSQIIQNLNLPLIIFTGGLTKSSELLEEILDKTIQKNVFPLLYSRLKLKYTVGNENFGILGGASLCLDSLSSP